ncbi:MAG: cytochrome c biogenesis protein CcsA, partial [Planctomycetes bacterium]|nr:cytochrome c biogenesis protein CcsA [Planctomycetota bacterium]
IAFILSVVALPWILFRDRHARSPELKSLLSTATIAVNIGTPLMFAGLILGGIWASESWGRFWGWDPKETWALVLFLYYTAMVHGRFTKWLNPFWSALGMFFGGVVLFFTYYGTNEFLTGLHSYAGASQDGGFWENMFHAKNLWFTVPCGIVMFLSIVVAPILYYVIPAKTPELDDDGSATTSKVDDDRMDGATARPIQG